jgi:hypothetical protein
MSQVEIAHKLQVSKQLVSSDIAYLRNQTKESTKEYVTEHLPEQYQVCLSALDTILKHTFNICRQLTITEKSCKQWKCSKIRIYASNCFYKVIFFRIYFLTSPLLFLRTSQWLCGHHISF